jgi:hypothetical protein
MDLDFEEGGAARVICRSPSPAPQLMVSIPSKPDHSVLRYVQLCAARSHNRSEDQIASDLGFGSPTALYQQLSQDGFPVCPVCGETPVKPHHCKKNKGQRQRRAKRGSGQAIDLPPAKNAEDMLRRAVERLRSDLLPLDSRTEIYKDERFEAVSDYPGASTTWYRDIFPPGAEGDEEWRKLCEKHGQNPGIDHFFAPHDPIFFPEGVTQNPPSPLTELIATYVLASEPLEPLLEALHPNPAEVDEERLDQAVDELRHKAGQLATIVRGGIIRRGPSTEDLSLSEHNAASFITSQLRQGVPAAELRALLRERGYSQQEFTRLKNLNIQSPQ